MTIRRSTLIGTAVAIALFGPDGPAQAQQLEEVVVSGIRYSNEKSLERKRAANSVVEVITAEDIGKMPDKNVADSLSRLPGVTVSSASANEGGFDENDRISMRGTNPSLTQTLINGHNVASGDWFVLNQTSQVGRSVSYTLLPSELVDSIVVHKSSQASLVEGGVAGSVNIVTRKPLDFAENLTFSASAGSVYSDLPDEFDPQLSALFNWKNDAGTVGVMLQAFSEERHLRRDGVELLGYGTIAPNSAIATSNPDLSGVVYPNLLGAALFEQQRERTGGLVDIEFRPSDQLRFDVQYFMSDLKASNYNRNYLFWGSNILQGGGNTAPGNPPFQAPDSGYVVRNGTLVEASWSGVGTPSTGVYDQISRPKAKASANYGSLGASYEFSDALTLSGEFGTSEGHGETPTQNVSETALPAGTGASYQLHGVGSAPTFNFGTADTTTPVPGGNPVPFGWIFGDQAIDVEDQEDWAQIDADYAIDSGAWTDLQFGLRYSNHSRDSLLAIGQGPLAPGTDPANYPTTFQSYPSDFSFGGAPANIWYWTPGQLADYNSPTNVNRDPVGRLDWNSMYQVEEKNSAAYVQADFAGSNWSGNIGLRFVQTKEDIITNVSAAATDPDATTTSAFGPFKQVPVDHTYEDWLPSANLRWEISEDVVARFAAAMTMTRPDYSALAGFVSLGPPPATLTDVSNGSGGNPDLEPIRSTNFDAGLEWYFAKNSLLGAGLFYMDLDNYVGFGTERKTYFTYSAAFPQGADLQYDLTVPVNAEGRVQGVELNYQQAINDNFGFAANYTYADGKQTSLVTNNDDRLVGTSKNTYNASAYFENERFNARVTYTHRSAFFSGLDRNTAFSQDAIGSLAASLGFTVNDNISVTLDGQNLTNETLKYFALNKDQPRAFYKNGAQYYLNVRFKF